LLGSTQGEIGVREVRRMFDWKPTALVLFGMCMGIFTGMQMNVDAQAHGQAKEMCKVCDANLNTMIDNFNVMMLQCRSYTIPNATWSENETVKAYVP
jgi:hypothetical protein